MKVLVVDVGGTHVKILVSGKRVSRKFPSGPTLTAKQMVSGVKKLAGDWQYDWYRSDIPVRLSGNVRPRNHTILGQDGLVLILKKHLDVR